MKTYGMLSPKKRRCLNEKVPVIYPGGLFTYAFNGFFFDWPGRRPQGHVVFNYRLSGECARYYKTDIPLIRDLGANTVRVCNDFGLDPAIKAIRNSTKICADLFFAHPLGIIEIE